MNGHIVIQGAGKAYRRFASRRHKWLEVLSMGWLVRHQSQWVLQSVNMEIQPGESVGLIGYNGAGKSTLLKLVAGVLTPTVGSVQSTGRIAAILELGVGFHMELTGRENIPLAGQLMGYTAQELVGAASDIMVFAELGDMIDQPLRAYSSGMLARLAFAIATAVRPDILIVDEALSVGDAYFQHKSFARIRAYKAAGTTTLFVSHDFSAIRALCDRVVLFSAGQLVMDGTPAAVLDYYNALISQREAQAGIPPAIAQSTESTSDLTLTQSGTGEATLGDVSMFSANGQRALRFATGDAVVIDVRVRVHQPVDSLVVGIMVRDRAGNPIFGTNSWHLRQPLLSLPANSDAAARFSLPLQLGAGSYSLSVALVDRDTHLSRNYDWRDNLLVFEVTNLAHPPFVGSVYLPTKVEVLRSHALWDLNRYGQRVYSQFGEDGILRRIFEIVGVENRFCVEFGGYDGITMSNTARLIREDGWRAGFIEADATLYAKLRANYFDHPGVQAIQAFVRPDNIESLLAELSAPRDMDLLCIDIDGNDYWVWQAIQAWHPRVIVIECNGAYAPPCRWVMAYADHHEWQGDDYYGASPQSLVELGIQKGYELVACEEQGANLFFVRADLYDRYRSVFGMPDNHISVLFRPPRYGHPDHRWTHPHREGPFESV